MLTVIIAPEEYIKSYENYSLFTEPLLNSKNVILCKCYYEEDSLEKMVPDLSKAIAGAESWRAVIVAPDNRYNFNPFDFTKYTDLPQPKAKNIDWDFFASRRKLRFENMEKAVKNPLLLLAFALYPNLYSKILMAEKDYYDLVNGNITEYYYMLKLRLDSLNVKKIAYQFIRTENERLKSFVGEENYFKIIYAIRDKNIDKILTIIGNKNIDEFNAIIGGNDARYTDPNTVEEDLINYKKYLLFSKISERFNLYDKLPTEVRCIALRCFDRQTYIDDKRRFNATLSCYSEFVKNNLLPEMFDFFVYDVISEKDKRYELDMLKFLSLLPIFAYNEFPSSTVQNGYLYRITCDYNREQFAAICQNYVDKLYATRLAINKKIFEINMQNADGIDDITAEKAFEQPVQVPVFIRKSQTKENLTANCEIGLSKNCPTDEEVLWNTQYNAITTKFVKYLREPKRAVTTAVKGKFRELNKVTDGRIPGLSDYQLEDIAFKLEEEERKMAETSTSHIFNSEKYTNSISEKNKKIKERIAQRMTKFTTVALGVIAVILFIIGFVPLFFTSYSTSKSVTTAIILILAVLGIMLATGFITLCIYRFLLKRAINKFNDKIKNICSEIDNSLNSFSEYLSHACNVMRKYSILNYNMHPEKDTVNILQKHQVDIEKCISVMNSKYSPYLHESVNKKIAPYDYDFFKPNDYEYIPEYFENEFKISFITDYNYVKVPVGYIKSILVTKEDLYD